MLSKLERSNRPATRSKGLMTSKIADGEVSLKP